MPSRHPRVFTRVACFRPNTLRGFIQRSNDLPEFLLLLFLLFAIPEYFDFQCETPKVSRAFSSVLLLIGYTIVQRIEINKARLEFPAGGVFLILFRFFMSKHFWKSSYHKRRRCGNRTMIDIGRIHCRERSGQR